MNKFYKIVWNVKSGNWMVVSELAKSHSKSIKKTSVFGLTAALLFFCNSAAYANECAFDPKKQKWTINKSNCEITGQTNNSVIGFGKILSLKNSTVNIIGDGNLTINSSIDSAANYKRYLSFGIDLQQQSQLLANDLNVNMQFNDKEKTASVKGIRVASGSTLMAKNVSSKVQYAAENNGNNNFINNEEGNPSGLSYALGVESLKDTETKPTQVIVENATLDITNTKNSNEFADSIPDQLVGLYVSGHDTNEKANAIFASTGKVTINAYDSSDSSIGQYIVGMAVSGADSKISLHDSEVTLGKSGKYSSAIKIGKANEKTDGEKISSGGYIESTGHMVLDSTAESEASTIRLVADHSKLIADFATSSSVIQSANTAILFDNKDYAINNKSKSKTEALMELNTVEKEAKDQEVRLRNTKITTTSQDASLFFTSAGVTNAQLSITGSESEVIAANNGWLTEVEGPSQEKNKPASMVFNLDDKAIAKGQMTTSGGSTLDVNVSNGAIWQLKPKNGLVEQRSTLTSLNLTTGGILDAASNMTSANSADYIINVPELNNDGGVIMLNTGKYKNSLTIEGDYKGSNGATVQVNAFETSADQVEPAVLHITGSVSGQTTINTVDASNLNGNIDQNKQKLESALNIQIDGNSTANAFIGSADTIGAGSAQLTSTVDENGKTIYYWTLTTHSNGVTGNNIGKDIYASAVPGYVVMPRVNQEQTYSAIATLKQRRGGDIQAPNWIRTFGQHIKEDGKNRLNLNSNIRGFQFGHDFWITQNEQSRNATGAYITYSHADTDFTDKYRAVNANIVADKYMGTGKSEIVSVGLTNTHYTANNHYLDLLGQLSYIRNQYESRNGERAKQNGWSSALSAEVGHTITLPWQLSGSWTLEPQAQLIYQYTSLAQINDRVRQIKQQDSQSLRGRLGARLALNQNTDNQTKNNTFYTEANIWHDFINPKAISIGADQIKEKYAKSWGEIGIGTQINLIKNGYIYSDAIYQHDFSSTKRTGWRGNIGFKYNWK